MKKPTFAMQIIMAVIYVAVIAGALTACIVMYLNDTFDALIVVIIFAIVAFICIPFPAYFIYILIKNAVGLRSSKNKKVIQGTVTAVEPHKRKSFSVFFARLEIKCGESVYYTNNIYYANAATELINKTVKFVTDKNKTAHIKEFEQ